MSLRLEGNIAILAGYVVFLVATTDVRLAVFVAAGLLVLVGIYKLRQSRG